MDIRDLQSALKTKLGASENRKGDHIFFFADLGQRNQRVAKFSHSARGQLPHFVVSYTAKALKLNNSQLNQFVDCTLSGDEVRQHYTDTD